MIGVLFVLLVVFVLSSVFFQRRSVLQLEIGSEGDFSRGKNRSVAIQASETGPLYWKQGNLASEKITLAELPARLVAYRRMSAQPSILIQGEKATGFGVTVAILDEVRKAGIEQVSVETHAGRTGN